MRSRFAAPYERSLSVAIRFGDGIFEVHPESKPMLEVVAEALGIKRLLTVATGGNSYEAEREQWDVGNNVVALEPGKVIANDRNTHTIRFCARPAWRSSPSAAPNAATTQSAGIV